MGKRNRSLDYLLRVCRYELTVESWLVRRLIYPSQLQLVEVQLGLIPRPRPSMRHGGAPERRCKIVGKSGPVSPINNTNAPASRPSN